MTQSDYYLSFSCAPGVGPLRFLHLLKHCKSIEKAWNATRRDFEALEMGGKVFNTFDDFRTNFTVKKYKDRLQRSGITYIYQSSKSYPKSLFDLPNPPIGLFAKGNVDVLQNTSVVAIVGSRKMTSYGKIVTQQLSEELTCSGIVVISGLALGVDAVAHRAAVEAQGKTIAVLGCGVDCCYPQENLFVYNSILDNGGCIISEYALAEPASKGSFPARNRIIAALSQAVLVTEAGVDSGSLITAEWAEKLKKKVFAVPGPITSRQSEGTAKLLKTGAIFVGNAEDIISKLPLRLPVKADKKVDYESLDITEYQKKILEFLSDEPKHSNEISKYIDTPVYTLSSQLSELEMLGLVRSDASGKWSTIVR